MQAGLALTVERVNAAGAVSSTESEDGSIVTIYSMPSEPEIYEFSAEDGGITITYYNIENADIYTKHFDKIAVLNIDGMSEARIKSDITIGQIVVEETGEIQIEDNCKLSCSEIVSKDDMNLLIGQGSRLECGSITAEEDGFNQINSYGYIICDSLDFSDVSYWGSDDSTITVTSSFINGSYNVEGKVIAERSTYISTAGGSFTLQVGGATKEITGNVSGYANEFVDDPEISLILNSDNSTVYYGTDYDFSKYVSVTEGYDKSLVTFEYSSDGGLTVLDEKPTYPLNGNYYVRAVAPADGAFIESKSEWKSYKIQYLPIEALEEFYEEGEPYVTVTGVIDRGEDEKYVSEGITLTAPEGVLIQFPYAGREALHTPAQSVTLTHDDLFLEGYTTINQDFEIQFVRDGDLATTQTKSILDVVDGIEDFIFDNFNPTFEAYIINAEDLEREVSVDEKGAVIEANELLVYVSDENLSTVLLTVDGTQKDISDKIEEGTCEINLTGMKTTQSIKITAADYANRISVAEFYLVKEREPVTVTLTDMPAEVYYGQDLSIAFDGKISVSPADYDGEPYFEYSTDGEIFSETASTGGTFWVRAVAPATTLYSGGVSEAKKYSRTYLPATAVTTTGNYYTLEGMKNGKYITDSVIMVAPEGFLISTNLTGINDFYESIKITDEGILSGNITSLSNLQIFFRRISDGASSNAVGVSSAYGVNPNFSNLVVDKYDPAINNASADGTGVSITDGCTIVADSLTFRVSDGYLDSVVVDGTEYEVTDNYGSRYVDVTLESTPLEPKLISVYAIDLAGRELDISFTLSHTPIDPERATITLEDVYYGEDYEPVVDTDSDGAITIYYRKGVKGSSSAILDEKPTEPGNYIVYAEISATDNYNATECSAEFEIKKAIPTINIIIPEEIYAGEEYVIEVETNSDAEVFKRFYYNDGGLRDTVFETEPTNFDDYIVTVTLQETDHYEYATASETYTVLGKSFTPVLTVEDCVVGETPVPVLTGVPEDYTGTITYEYKTNIEGMETDYAEGWPTLYGSYTVRAIFPSTGVYYGTFCTDDFTISKKSVTATVSVDDIYVGGTITPVLTIIEPEDYEYFDEPIYQYKLKAAPDTEYSTTVPTDAGEYTVMVLVPPTDVYNGGSCTDNFEIKKYETSAFITVDNITYGETVSPVVTVDPEGYNNTDNISFKYKLSGDPDTAYSSAVPTAAGTYTVLATVPATDKYTGTTCEAEFTIDRYDITGVEVTVENIKVGQVPSPSVAGLPEDYDGEITYAYIGGDGETFSAESLKAGTYTVIASISDTDNYVGMTCETELEVSKSDITDVEVSVDDIKVGQVPAPSLTGLPADYDGEITIEYLGGNGENGSADSLAAGSYLVRVTIPETDKYEGTSCETDLEVSKYDIAEAEVTIENIKVGQVPAPSIKGIPEDYDGEITIEYLGGNGENGSADSLAAGSYLVRVTIPETDKYEKKVLETDLVVSKNDITEAKVTVENILVGQTPAPVVTGLPEDYDGTVTFEYFDGNGEDCSADSLAAGGYHVIASIPETDKYERITCETDLVVSKYDVDASVTAADILVGGKVDPVITIDPEDYDGEITIEYKGDADQGYSTTVPTAAGSYSVRVTLSETEKYLGTTCEDTFTISKNEATATVTVADIYVGGTVKPVVTTVSNGKVTFEYKLSSAPDTAYTTTVPTAAGEYTVRATIAATAEYLGTTCEDTFRILKKEVTAKVTVADIYVGEIPNPVVSTVSKGKVTFEYKLSSDPDTAYSKTVPTAAGEYTVRATVAETDEYLSTTCEATFRISKSAVSASVKVADIYVGETPNPVVSTVSKGKVTFEYKPYGAADSEYSDTVPSEAGDYTVRATIAETDAYLSTTCEDSFSILKRTATATVTVENILVGGTVKPVVTTESDGKVTIEYKLSSDPDSAYTETVPSVAGEYTVRATVAESKAYLGTTCTSTFTISKNETTATVSVADIYVGGKVTPVVSTVSNGKDDATFEYKLSADPDENYSETVPTAAGEYTVRATIPATVEYAGIICTSEFKIMLNPVTKMELTVPDIYYGQPVKYTFDTESNGTVTIMYKPFEAEDSEYTDKVPAAVGKYTAIAIVSATDFYASASVTADFSISYLENPQIVYVPSGTPGDNGYYTSDVDLKAPDGFLISATPDGEFTDKIPFTEDLNVIYLKRIEDNALTAAITLENKPKIDKVAPVFTELTGGLVEDAILFIESMEIRVDDLNLVSLTVNGEAVDLTSSGANILTLTRPEEGYMTYHIVAIDVAGNVSVLDITLMADWLRERIIPVGKSLPLAKGELYFLDVGEWTVSIVNKDGTITESKTVFSGNMPFYVNVDADYIFTKVT